MEVLTLLLANTGTIAEVLLAVHALALTVIQFSPKQINNPKVALVFKVIEFAAGLFTKAARSNTPTAPKE